MGSSHLPSISVLIPTLNAARVLEKCLTSLVSQDYPKEKVEIIIADGGSTDNTLGIISKFQIPNSKFQIKVFPNSLKTGEAGKAVALRQAIGKLVVLIDSDNVLPDKTWLIKMVDPFSDPEIIGSEPWKFTYRRGDSLVNRYCALIGANDPYCYFVGNYDKRSVLSGKWTGMKVQSSKFKVQNGRIRKTKGKGWDYLKARIRIPNVPTIGANGTVWRAEVLKKAVGKSQYLFDTDIPYILARRESFYFAQVKVGIIHDYCHSVKDFYRKQKRRAKDFFYLEGRKEREETYQRQLAKQLYFILSTVLVIPLFIQTVKGYLRKPDKAWFFHPLACWLTLLVYGGETLLGLFGTEQMNRKNWHQ